MNVVIDGTDKSGCQAGDATNGPFYPFDIDAQENSAGPFRFRFQAAARLALANSTESIRKIFAATCSNTRA